MKPRNRKPIRLRGYDYTGPGAYFVTICTAGRVCIMGDVVDGVMRLSEVGEIAAGCWKEIPAHFENVRLGAFQVMPNHVHGVINIVESPVGTRPAKKTAGLRHAIEKKSCRDVAPPPAGSSTCNVIELPVGTRHAVEKKTCRDVAPPKCGGVIDMQRPYGETR